MSFFFMNLNEWPTYVSNSNRPVYDLENELNTYLSQWIVALNYVDCTDGTPTVIVWFRVFVFAQFTQSNHLNLSLSMYWTLRRIFASFLNFSGVPWRDLCINFGQYPNALYRHRFTLQDNTRTLIAFIQTTLIVCVWNWLCFIVYLFRDLIVMKRSREL